MKVLITDGSNPVTWYHDMEGRLFDVAYIKDNHIFVKGVDNDGPAGVHMPDGEILYTEAEYNDLAKKLKQAEADEKRAVANADRLTDVNNRLRRRCKDLYEEKAMLLQQIEQEVDRQQLVSIPRRVAEAIENLYKLAALSERVDIEYIIEGRVKQDFNGAYDALNHVDVELLARALVNGYEIEDALEEQIYQTCKSWYEKAVEGARDDVARSLAKRITEIVNESKAT